MIRAATLSILALLGGWLLIGMPVEAQEPSGPTQTDAAQIGSRVSETLEALRTLLHSTESRLEQLETRLDSQDERTSRLQSEVEDLRQRVEEQRAELREARSSRQGGIQALRTLVIAGGVALIALGLAAFGIILRRLRSLEAVPDHVGRGVEQDEAEESSQQ